MNEVIFGIIFSLIIGAYHFYRSIVIELVYVGNKSKIEARSIGVVIIMRAKKFIEQHVTNVLMVNRNKIFFSILSYNFLAMLYYFSCSGTFSSDYTWPFLIYIVIRIMDMFGVKNFSLTDHYNEIILNLILLFIFLSLMITNRGIHHAIASLVALYFVDIAFGDRKRTWNYVSSVKYFAHYYLFSKIILDSFGIFDNSFSVLLATILTFIVSAWFMFLNSYGMFVNNVDIKHKAYWVPMLLVISSALYWTIYDSI